MLSDPGNVVDGECNVIDGESTPLEPSSDTTFLRYSKTLLSKF